MTCHIITAVIATSGTLAATGIGTGPGAAGAVVVTGSEVLVLGGALVTMNAVKVVNKRIPRGFSLPNVHYAKISAIILRPLQNLPLSQFSPIYS